MSNSILYILAKSILYAQTVMRIMKKTKNKSKLSTKFNLDLGDKAIELLKALNLSRTQARVEILKIFLDKICIVSAEDIFSIVKHFGFDLTTVYRTVLTFEENGLITRVQLADGVARYEMKNLDGHHHHHIICRSCKKIEIIRECVGEKLNKLGQRLGFSQVEHSLEFYGLCPKCEMR